MTAYNFRCVFLGHDRREFVLGFPGVDTLAEPAVPNAVEEINGRGP